MCEKNLCLHLCVAMMGTWNHEGGTSVDKLIILIINISTMLSHDVGYSGVERGRIETG